MLFICVYFQVVTRQGYNMSRGALLLLACISHACGLVTYENVVFEKSNSIYTNNARWLLTFVHDLEPYERFIDTIGSDLNDIRDTVQVLESQYRRNSLTGYEHTVTSLALEVEMVKDMYIGLKDNFDDLRSVSSHEEPKPVGFHRTQELTRSNRPKNKRAILPFIGQLSSFLFGTVSEDDLEDIHRNLNRLATNQNKMIHAIDQSLTLLNLTRVQVSENRRAIIDAIIYIQKLDAKISALQERFAKALLQMEQFVGAYHQIELIITEIRYAAQNAASYLLNLKMELNMLSLNHLSPSTISPN